LILVTTALDTERIFPGESIPDQRFLMGGFMLIRSGNGHGISQMSAEVVPQQNIGGLIDTAAGLLHNMLSMGLTAADLFKSQAVDPNPTPVSIDMPLGLPHAVAAWHAKAVALLRSLPARVPMADRIDHAFRAMYSDGAPFPAGGAAPPPGAREAAEAAAYDVGFYTGAQLAAKYSSDKVCVCVYTREGGRERAREGVREGGRERGRDRERAREEQGRRKGGAR
jgi:hypothetical protein